MKNYTQLKSIALIVSLMTSYSGAALADEKIVIKDEVLTKSSFNHKPRVTVKTLDKSIDGKSMENSQRLSNRKNKRSLMNNGVTVNVRSEAKIDRTNLKQSVVNPSSSKYTVNSKQAIKTRQAKSTGSYSVGFSIVDAWTSLGIDEDYDGYYSEFTLSFDADFSDGYADVYADVYTSYEGGEWVYLYTTSDFTIYANDSNDYYSAAIDLNSDFEKGAYDIAIDLFEVGYSDVVATIEAVDDVDLYNLPLEAIDQDQTWISFVASDLFSDYDNDGFYSQVTIEYDIETRDIGRLVYADIDIINLSTGSVNTVSTQDFNLANTTEFIDIDFDSGYSTDYYDIEVYLVDSSSGNVVTDTQGGFTSLKDLPIESDNYDDSGVDVILVAEGSGSLSYLLLMLGLLIIMRYFNQQKRDENFV